MEFTSGSLAKRALSASIVNNNDCCQFVNSRGTGLPLPLPLSAFPSRHTKSPNSLDGSCRSHRRVLSTVKDAVSPVRKKFYKVLEEYRQKNFTQTLFSRFVKQLTAAADVNHDGKLSLEELKALLHNIGFTGALSVEELEELVDELGTELTTSGGNEKLIPIDEIEDILVQASRSKD